MPLTEEQRELRRQHIGASDAAAICGVDPFKSAGDVYIEKVHPTEDIKANEAIDLGNELEDTMLKLAERQLGVPITRGQYVRDGVLAVNFDGLIARGTDIEVVEAKTTGIMLGWGDEDEPNAVPEKVLVQTHRQMHAIGAIVAYVPVLIGAFGLKFRIYRVERIDELAENVTQRCRDFWANHIEPKIPPPGSVPSLEVLKRIIRVPEKTVPIATALIDALADSKAQAKESNAGVKLDQAALIAALGDAEGSECGRVTYLEIQRKGYTVDASSYRRLNIKKAK